MICTTACVSALAIPDLTDVCGEVTTREELPSKLVIFRCDVAIPSGIDSAKAAALATLLGAGTMGVTGKLKNFQWGDPSTSEISFADCYPIEPFVTGRTLTFDDYNAIDVDPTDSSSAPYYDRDFWATIKSGKGKWNFGWSTCEGLLYLATNAAGTQFMTGIGQIFQTEDRSQTNKIIEVKKGIINFLGDPKSFTKPYLDMTAYSSLLGLY